MRLLYFKIQRLITITNYLSNNKVMNWFRLIISYYLSFSGLVKHKNIFPAFISVEVTNFCNLHCPECPVGTREINQSERKMFDFVLYQKLIDELKPTLQHIILYFQGEPFINSQIFDLIKYGHDAKIYTSTSTNGQFLTDDNAKRLILSGLDKLIVSLDGSTQEVYETYRVGGSLEKSLEGIKKVLYWRTELKSSTPMVEIQFLVLKTNEHQLEEMKRLAKQLGVDRLTFKTAQLNDFKHGNPLMPTRKKYSRYKKDNSGKYRIKSSQPNRCWRLWSGAVVNVHGEVLPCCFDKTSEHSFGNILENYFSACWSGNKASGFRAKILQNRKQFEICRNCTSN
ncbi:MAG: radical SAM/SPASM domain-containing protein [Paludibacter sp.]|nr:radical SAM/SPASM domain-containing protein [Paludibacter sp.]